MLGFEETDVVALTPLSCMYFTYSKLFSTALTKDAMKGALSTCFLVSIIEFTSSSEHVWVCVKDSH